MSKIQRIEISFPVPVDLPDGWERALDGLVGMVCEAYQRANPTRVMWPAGQGSLMMGLHSPDGPTFDDSVYAVDVAEREDTGGSNPHNPDRARLSKEAHAPYYAEKAARKAKIDALIAAANEDGPPRDSWIVDAIAALREKGSRL